MPVDVKTFAKRIKEKYPAYKDVDDLTLSKRVVEKYPEYKDKVDLNNLGTVKKKENTISSSEDSSSDIQKEEVTEPSVSSGEKVGDLYKLGGKSLKYKDGNWYEYSYTNPSDKGNVDIYDDVVTDAELVNSFNKEFNQSASTSQYEKVFTGYPGKETNEYKISSDGNWQRRQPGKKEWTTIFNEGSINALNNEFGGDVSTDEKEIEAKKIAKQAKDIEKQTLESKLDAVVTSDLMSKDEEEVKEVLLENFPELSINEYGAFTDNINIGVGGSVMETSLDDSDAENVLTAKKIKDFIRNNYDKESIEAVKTLSDNDVRVLPDGTVGFDLDKFDPVKLKDAESAFDKKITEKYKTILDEERIGKDVVTKLATLPNSKYVRESIDNSVKDVTVLSKDFEDYYKEMSVAQNELQAKINSGELTVDQAREQMQQATDKLEEKRTNVYNAAKEASILRDGLNKSVANDLLVKEQYGNFGGGVTKSFVKGLTTISRLVGADEEDHKEIVKSIMGSGTTDEYIGSEDRSDLSKALFSLSESMGVGLSGAPLGGAGQIAAFGNQAFFESYDEMDKIEGISGAEKVLVSGAYAVASGFLEKLGMKSILGKSDIGDLVVKSVLKKSFKELPKNATKEMIETALKSNSKFFIKELVARKAVGGAIEGVTEILQATTKAGLHELSDYFHGEDNFNKNKGLEEMAKDILYEGYLGMLGGHTMGAMSGATEIVGNYVSGKKVSDKWGEEIAKTFPAFRDNDVFESKKEDLKISRLEGEITEDEYQKQKSELDNIREIATSIPSDYSAKQAGMSAELILERQKIEEEIAGIEPKLAIDKKNRIEEINKQLEIIGSKTDERQDIDDDGDVQPGAEPSETQGQDTDVQETVEPTRSEEQTQEEVEEDKTETSLPTEENKVTEQADNQQAEQTQQYTDSELKNMFESGPMFNLEQEAEQELKEKAVANKKRFKKVIEPTKEEIKALAFEKFKNNVKNFRNDGSEFKWTVHDIRDGFSKKSGSNNNTSDFSPRDNRHERLEDGLAYEERFAASGEKIVYISIPVTDPTGQPRPSVIATISIAVPTGMTSAEIAQPIIDTVKPLVDKATSISDITTTKQMQEIAIPIAESVIREKLSKSGTTEQADSQAEVKESSTGDKMLDLLDKASEAIDNQLRSGINDATRVIPLKTMKLIVEALKVAVKTGMKLEEAIKKAAKDFNVNESDIENSLYSMTESQKRKLKERVTGEKQPKPKISDKAKDAKNISKTEKTKITVNEMTALKDQIKLEARAAREGRKSEVDARKGIKKILEGRLAKGSVNATKLKAIINKLSSLNFKNEEKVKEFEEYLNKAFDVAEINEKFNQAKTIRKSLKRIRKDIQFSNKALTKAFLKIDLKYVTDFDKYIELAKKVKETNKSGGEVADFKQIQEFTQAQLDLQEKIAKDNLLDKFKDLVDQKILSDTMSVKEIQEVLKSIENNEEADTKDTEAFLDAMTEWYMSDIQKILDNDEDLTEQEKSILNKFLKIDTSRLSLKEKSLVYDYAGNYVTNGVYDNMVSVTESYMGKQKAADIRAKGFKKRRAKDVVERMFPKSNHKSETISKLRRFVLRQTASLPVLADGAFSGIVKGAEWLNALGYSKMAAKAVKAQKIYEKYINTYKDKYKKVKDFGEAKNIYERMMLADLLRRPKDETVEKNFNDKKRSLLESRDNLLNSNSTDLQKKGQLYDEVIKKIGLEFADKVEDLNIEKFNESAVQDWIDIWASIYDELSFIQSAIYNKELVDEHNYTPRVLRNIQKSKDKEAIVEDENFFNSITRASEGATNVLMPSSKVEIAKNNKYKDLDFDSIQSNALKAALMDIHTAGTVRQINGFIKSKDFDEMFEDSDDADMFKDRIIAYVNKVTGKERAVSDMRQELSIFNNLANKYTTIATAQALVGIATPILQTVPVLLNTFINVLGEVSASGVAPSFTLYNPLNEGQVEFLDKIDSPVTRRGADAFSSVDRAKDTLNKAKGVKNVASKALDGVSDLAQWQLENIIGKPDSYAATSSLLTYYKMGLKQQGIKLDDFDWGTEVPNKKALDYANQMVDRQQNVSDQASAGLLFSSNDPVVKKAKQVFFPFATFITNQQQRLYSDVRTALRDRTTPGDKKRATASALSAIAEIIAYNALAYGAKELIYQPLVNAWNDEEDTEEDRQRRRDKAKRQTSGAIITDLFSPSALFNNVILNSINFLLRKDVDEKEKKEAIKKENIRRIVEEDKDPMTPSQIDNFIENEFKDFQFKVFENNSKYGVYDIPIEKVNQKLEQIDAAFSEGYITVDSKFGDRKVYIPEEFKDDLKVISIGGTLNTLTTAVLPKDVSNVGNKIYYSIIRKSLSGAQHDDYLKYKAKVKRDLSDDEIALIKAGADLDLIPKTKEMLKGLKGEARDKKIKMLSDL